MDVNLLNIALFLISTSAYFLVWALWTGEWLATFGKRHLVACAVIAVLCVPFNVGGNVYTVLGNAHSKNDVNSVFSVYQHAEGQAFAIISVGYQHADNQAVQLAGVGYQYGRYLAAQFVGIAYQYADKRIVQFIGIARQHSRGNADQGLGISYQHGKVVGQIAGLTIQYADVMAKNYLSIALWQQVADATKSFAIWSTLEKQEK